MYSSLSGLHCRAFTYLIVVATILLRSAGKLVIAPRDTESKVGDATFFNCSTDLETAEIFWNHGKKYIYNGQGILDPYSGRFEIDRSASIGSHNLVIYSVEPGDAGEYTCRDDDGAGTTRSAKLIVLENDPDCHFNIQPDGVIAQNVFNIPPDEVQLTCTVAYYGSEFPWIEWEKIGSNSSINNSWTSLAASSNRLTHTLNLKGDISLENSSYVCQTKRAIQNQYNCTRTISKVLYFVSENTIEQNVVRGETITCTASSGTFPCTSQWYHDNYTCPLSCDESITAHLLGTYLCTVKCHVRERDYFFEALKAFVVEPAAPPVPHVFTAGTILASFVVPIIFIILVLLTVVFLVRRCRTRTAIYGERQLLKYLSAGKAREPKGSTGQVNEDEIELLQKIKKGSNLSEQAIRGVAILDKKLFVVRKGSSKLRIYNCNDNRSNFQDWTFVIVKQLVSTYDMCSSNLNNCLYIMDMKTRNIPQEVLSISSEGKVLHKWVTEEGAEGNLSTTEEGNVIITDEFNQVLLEYSPDGILVRKIYLPWCSSPSHAIKRGDHYIVSHGAYHDPLKRVCLVDQNGNVEKSFGPEIGCMPGCLAAGSSGCVIVADAVNNMVLLLDSNLEFKAKLVPKYRQRFLFPFDICLDETLLVVVMFGGEPYEKTGDHMKKSEEGGASTKNNDWLIDKNSRVLVFDVESVFRKYFG